MGTSVREATVDAVHAVALEQPLAAPAPALRLVLSRRAAAAIGSCGRFGVVWLPAYALMAGRTPSLGVGVGLATLLALVWTAALSRTFSTARLTLLSLGPAPAAALGTGAGLVAISALSLWSGLGLTPRVELELAIPVCALSAVWEGLVHRSLAGCRRVLVVGADDGGAELLQELALGEPGPFEPLGLVDDDCGQEQIAGLPVLRLGDLAALSESRRPDLVVADPARPEAVERLLDVAGLGFTVVTPAEFHEHAFGRVPVSTLTPTWFAGVVHLYRRPYSRLAKRAFDLALAAVGLALAAPLWPVLAWLVSRTPGPVIFRQTRLGEGGRPFTIYKLRTMRADAEAGGAVWAAERDPRVTPIGGFLRRTRLDELPQLWNVLRGDMSIVGPRPERPEFVEQLQGSVPFWTRRHLVKPGLTGWAQVRRGYTADAEGTAEKLAYDLWYLRHRSLLLDVAICVKTVSTLLTGAGAR